MQEGTDQPFQSGDYDPFDPKYQNKNNQAPAPAPTLDLPNESQVLAPSNNYTEKPTNNNETNIIEEQPWVPAETPNYPSNESFGEKTVGFLEKYFSKIAFIMALIIAILYLTTGILVVATRKKFLGEKGNISAYYKSNKWVGLANCPNKKYYDPVRLFYI